MTRWGRASSMLRLLPALAALLLVASSAPAQTASTNQRALAEALFREARELMADERYLEACAKFAESQRLDPGGGTLLNLAVCHEAAGKIASAWAEFQEALAMARADDRQDRVDLALEHIAALEPRLAKLTLEVEGEPPRELEVSINAMQVGSAAWGSAVPVDPGSVELRAEAPGYESFVKTVEIAEGQQLAVSVPALQPLSDDPGLLDDGSEAGIDGESGSKTSAALVGAVGIAAIGVGGYFGVRAMQEKSKADDNGCNNSGCSTERGREADENAVFNGWLATAGIGVGLAALGVATYLYLDSDGPSEGPPGSAAVHRAPADYALVPVISDQGASLWFNSTF